MTLQIAQTKLQDADQMLIHNILLLKDSTWKYGLDSQQDWWSRYSKDDDILVHGMTNDKLISFCRLSRRAMCVDQITLKATCITEFIVHKDFRKNNYGLLMLRYITESAKSTQPIVLLTRPEYKQFFNHFMTETLVKPVLRPDISKSKLAAGDICCMASNLKAYNYKSLSISGNFF